MIIGDIKSKVGRLKTVGKYGVGTCTDLGEQLMDLLLENNLLLIHDFRKKGQCCNQIADILYRQQMEKFSADLQNTAG